MDIKKKRKKILNIILFSGIILITVVSIILALFTDIDHTMIAMVDMTIILGWTFGVLFGGVKYGIYTIK